MDKTTPSVPTTCYLLVILLAFDEPLANLVLHGLSHVRPLHVSEFFCDGHNGFLVVLLMLLLLLPAAGFVGLGHPCGRAGLGVSRFHGLRDRGERRREKREGRHKWINAIILLVQYHSDYYGM